MVNKKEDLLSKLREMIIDGYNPNHFNVAPLEAGLGKTIESEKALVDVFNKSQKRSILVRADKDDGQISERRINEYAEDQLSFAVNGSNVISAKKDLSYFPIIIITHERYKLLSKNKTDRELFTSGRSILVIDEKINMLQISSVSKTRLDEFRGKLSKTLSQLYDKETAYLYKILDKNSSMHYFRTKEPMKTIKRLKYVKSVVEANINQIYYDNYNTDKDFYIRMFDDIIELYNPDSITILDGKSAHTYKPNIKYWLLENNIMLDANGAFEAAYQLSELFNVVDFPSIIDFSKWTFYHKAISAINITKKKSLNFYNVFHKSIIENTKLNDKMLIVTNKKEKENNLFQLESITDCVIEILYHNNLIGKNICRDFNKVYLPHTPQIPFWKYALEYHYYSNQNTQLDDKKLQLKRDPKNNNVFSFADKTLNRIRFTQIAGSLYQAIMRINRNNEHIAEVFLPLEDMYAYSELMKMFPNAKIKELEVEEIEFPETNQEIYKKKREKESLKYKFIDLMETLSPNKYEKSDIAKKMKCHPNSLSATVFKKEEVVNYCDENNIIINNKYVIKYATSDISEVA